MIQILQDKIIYYLMWTVLSLAIIALVAELLPEVKAKMIVIPTLLLVIGLMTVMIRKNKW